MFKPKFGFGRRGALALLPVIAAAFALGAPSAALASGPALSVTAVANSATTSPSTSFTQGDGTTTFPGTGPDTYTLNVTNTGDTATSGTATVTAALGSGQTYVSRTVGDWTCSGTTTTTCTSSDVVAPGDSYNPIVITASVSTTAGANSQGGGNPAHVNLNVTALGGGATSTFAQTFITPLVGRPNLTSVDSMNGTFTQGDGGDSYTINVFNQGLGATASGTGSPPAAPIVATETVPAGETAVSLSGSGWTCSLAATTAGVSGAVYTEPANTCYRTDSWPGYTSLPPITLVVSAASNATTPETLNTIVSGGGSVTASNTVGVSTPIAQSPDLTLATAHVGPFAQGDGESAGDTYTITASNVIGPNSIAGGPTVGPVIVTDSPALGQRITRLSGNGWTCNLAPVQLTGSPNVIVPADSCVRADAVSAGASYPAITATVTVDDDAQSGGANSATVTGGGMTAASTANGGQTASDTVVVAQMPDLMLAVSNSGPFVQGDAQVANDAYEVQVQNVGFASTNAAVPVTVVDRVPSDLTPVSASGSGWNCTVTGQTVACTSFDPVGVGSNFPTITIPVTVASDAGTDVENPVEVSGGDEIEPGNDRSNAQTYIHQLPDLTVSATHSGNFTQGDAADSYTLLVSNANLADTTTGATVIDTLPSGVTATAIAGTGWSCTLATLTCTRSDTLPSSGFYSPITVTVAVSATAPASVTNAASVSGGGEIYTADDIAHDPTTIQAKTPPPPPSQFTLSVSVGGTGTGTVTSLNVQCPGTCSGVYVAGTVVTLTATPTNGSTFAGWGGACTGTGTCTVTMDAAKSVTATFTAAAPPPPPPPPPHKGAPKCTVTVPSGKVALVERKVGHSKVLKASQVSASAKCDQAAAAVITGTVTEKVKEHKGRKTVTRTIRVKLSTVKATLGAGVTRKLTVSIPVSVVKALQAHDAVSVTLSLTAKNANGTGRHSVTKRLQLGR